MLGGGRSTKPKLYLSIAVNVSVVAISPLAHNLEGTSQGGPLAGIRAATVFIGYAVVASAVIMMLLSLMVVLFIRAKWFLRARFPSCFPKLDELRDNGDEANTFLLNTYRSNPSLRKLVTSPR